METDKNTKTTYKITSCRQFCPYEKIEVVDYTRDSDVQYSTTTTIKMYDYVTDNDNLNKILIEEGYLAEKMGELCTKRNYVELKNRLESFLKLDVENEPNDIKSRYNNVIEKYNYYLSFF